MPVDPERYATVANVKSDRNILGADFDEEIRDVLGAVSEYLDAICGPPETDEVREESYIWKLMSRRLTARWWDRRQSSVGIDGGFGDVPVYVKGLDPDIDTWIVSQRNTFGISGGHQDLVDVP